jgi:arylformamidase
VNLDSYQIYDISPEISPQTAVFPGDTPFSAQFLLDMKKGHNLTLSSIQTTVHIGAHTDAPSHYSVTGQTIEQRDLKIYLGLVQVITVNLPRKTRITPLDFEGVMISAPRVLFKTNSFPDPNHWNDDFCALSPDLIEFLHKKNVCLVGLDTPSVDLADDKFLVAHHAIDACDMAIIEGVVLDAVPDGLYQLMALPLKMKGADATPVRAVLLSL